MLQDLKLKDVQQQEDVGKTVLVTGSFVQYNVTDEYVTSGFVRGMFNNSHGRLMVHIARVDSPDYHSMPISLARFLDV